MTKKILLIEDEDTLRESLKRVLSKEGYDITGVDSAEAALDLLDDNSYDLILTDVILPGISGIELLKRIRERLPDQIVVVMTAFASLETAVESLRSGAYDYIIKPIMHEEIKQVVKNALKQGALQEENLRLKRMLNTEYDIAGIIAISPSMQDVMSEIGSIGYRENIFILGEIGTGKELIARTIHASSNRSEKPFITLNRRVIPQEFFEQSVFGLSYKRSSRQKGLLEEANEGTLFIRELCDLPLSEQERLFSVIKNGEITFPDSKIVIKTDVRLIAASSRLSCFKDDMLRMINARLIKMPPLRERRDDIVPLANFFIERFSKELCKDIKGIDSEAVSLLINYHWPGNVRELKDVIERAVLITGGDCIGRDDILIKY